MFFVTCEMNVNHNYLTSDYFIRKITDVTSQTPSAPLEVLSFKVLSISTTDVILGWEPSSLSSQKGLVLYYQIGVNQKEKGN